jgi:hypothetical protein
MNDEAIQAAGITCAAVQSHDKVVWSEEARERLVEHLLGCDACSSWINKRRGRDPFLVLVEALKALTGIEDERLLVEGAVALEDLGLLPLPSTNGAASAPVGLAWQPHVFTVPAPVGGVPRRHSAAIEVRHERGFYDVNLTLRLLVGENGDGTDPVFDHVEAERASLRAVVSSLIQSSAAFKALEETLSKSKGMAAHRSTLAVELADLEERQHRLADTNGDAASLAKQARVIAESLSGVRSEMTGVDALLADYRSRREREEKVLHVVAERIWVEQVSAHLAKWESARFDLCGLLDGGDVQGKLHALCRLAMTEWHFRHLGRQADIEVGALIKLLLPELSILVLPAPSEVGVTTQQVLGMGGRAAVTITPPPPAPGQVDQEPVRTGAAGSFPGEMVPVPTEAG